MSSLIPDLYDRFAAPIEERYSERGARALVEQAGCSVRAWRTSAAGRCGELKLR